MQTAALITVHQYPGLAARLIKTLIDSGIDVFVHVDARAADVQAELERTFSSDARVVFVKKRYKVFWGSFNQVLATLELMRAAAETKEYEYYSFLSGQDLPIRSLKEFQNFLFENKGKEFLHWYKLPHHENHGITGGLDRVEYYWFNDNTRFKRFNAKMSDLVHKLQNLLKLKRKLNFELYAGSNWFTLSDAAVRYCLDLIDRERGLLKRFKFTRCADEIFFQTMLLNSPFKENIVNNNLRYVDWQSGPEYPRILRMDDLQKLRQAKDTFFARKFDERTDAQVIQLLVSANGK